MGFDVFSPGRSRWILIFVLLLSVAAAVAAYLPTRGYNGLKWADARIERGDYVLLVPLSSINTYDENGINFRYFDESTGIRMEPRNNWSSISVLKHNDRIKKHFEMVKESQLKAGKAAIVSDAQILEVFTRLESLDDTSAIALLPGLSLETLNGTNGVETVFRFNDSVVWSSKVFGNSPTGAVFESGVLFVRSGRDMVGFTKGGCLVFCFHFMR